MATGGQSTVHRETYRRKPSSYEWDERAQNTNPVSARGGGVQK
jgi:hypothetical protein